MIEQRLIRLVGTFLFDKARGVVVLEWVNDFDPGNVVGDERKANVHLVLFSQGCGGSERSPSF